MFLYSNKLILFLEMITFYVNLRKYNKSASLALRISTMCSGVLGRRA